MNWSGILHGEKEETDQRNNPVHRLYDIGQLSGGCCYGLVAKVSCELRAEILSENFKIITGYFSVLPTFSCKDIIIEVAVA